MRVAKIDTNICQREEECVASLSCPIGAISRTTEDSGFGPSQVDDRRCLGCGKCIRFCTPKAISL